MYWVDEDESSFYELTFGDGFFGRPLPDGVVIHVNYIQTNGSFGNGVQGVNNFGFVGNIFDSYKTPITNSFTITSVDPSNGGSELESVPSAN